MTREVSTRFTFDPGIERLAVWSPDGNRIVFHSDRNTGFYDLYQKSSTGTGNEELLLQSPEQKYPADWSRDGRFLVYETMNTPESITADLWVLPLSGEPKPFLFLKTPFHETQAQLSPDGQWMAYVSNESGRDEVYLASFPKPSLKVRVSTGGGRQPRWRRDGKELFFISLDSKLMAVSIPREPASGVGTPEALFEAPFSPSGTGVPYPATSFQYDVTADGQRFLMRTPAADSTVPITVVLNWTAALKK